MVIVCVWEEKEVYPGVGMVIVCVWEGELGDVWRK